MSVSQRKDGRWLVKYKDTTSGKWLQRTFRDEAEARRFDDEARYDAQAATPMTLGECVVAYVRSHEMAEHTKEQFSFLVNGRTRKDGKHTDGPAEFLAEKYCTRLDRRDLENVRLNLSERGNKATTANGYIGKLQSALSWAASEDLISENPWAKYKKHSSGRSTPRNGKFEDFLKIYELLPDWAQWASRTCLALCLRPGEKELGGLKWTAFDWYGKSVSVYMPKVDATKVVYPPENYLTEALERHKNSTSEYVCTNWRGGAFSYNHFCKVWAASCRKVEVKMPPYAMRHMAASMMLAGGADLAAVAAQLGHASVTTTASFYLHAMTNAQKRAAALNPLVQLGAEIAVQSKE